MQEPQSCNKNWLHDWIRAHSSKWVHSDFCIWAEPQGNQKPAILPVSSIYAVHATNGGRRSQPLQLESHVVNFHKSCSQLWLTKEDEPEHPLVSTPGHKENVIGQRKFYNWFGVITFMAVTKIYYADSSNVQFRNIKITLELKYLITNVCRFSCKSDILYQGKRSTIKSINSGT